MPFSTLAGGLGLHERPQLFHSPLPILLQRAFCLLGLFEEPLVGPLVHPIRPIRKRLAEGALTAELLLDPGGLLQPAVLPVLPLAPVAEPATPPAAKVD